MYTGITGALKIVNQVGDTVPVAYISGWSIDDKTEIVEASRFSSFNAEILPGFQRWSASADGSVSFADGSGQAALFAAKNNGAKVIVQFYLHDAQSDGEKNTYFSGEAYIESLSVDLSAEDKGNISIGVSGNGPLRYFVDDVDIVTGAETDPHGYLSFRIQDGNLYATVPNNLENAASLDADGQLIIKI